MKRLLKDTGFLAVLGLAFIAMIAVLLTSYSMFRFTKDRMKAELNKRTLQAVHEARRVYLEEEPDAWQGRLESIRSASKLEGLFVFDINRKSLVDANKRVPIGKQYTFLQLPHSIDEALKKKEDFITEKEKEDFFRAAALPLIVNGEIMGGVYADVGIDYKKSLDDLQRKWVFATVLTFITTLILTSVLFVIYRRSEKLHENMHRYSRLEVIHLLSAGIAHDIKNPVAVITSSAESLEHRLGSNDEQSKKYISFISRGAKQVLEIIETLLGSGRGMDAMEIDLKPFLERIILKFQPMATAKGVSILKELDQVEQAWASITTLRMAFSNILQNAIEAVEENNGQIQISARQISSRIRLSVSDNGPGISPKMQKKIFHPMITTKKSGSGFGLPVARQLMEDMKGELKLESVAGKGSTFILWMPVKNKR